jgi:hypothetical protein
MTKPIKEVVAEIDAQMNLDPAYLEFHGHSLATVRLRTDDWLALKTALQGAARKHEPVLARTFRLGTAGLRCGFCDAVIPSPSEPRKCCADGREEDARNNREPQPASTAPDAKDAERYRWLRRNIDQFLKLHSHGDFPIYGNELDDQLDRARGSEGT